MQARGTIEDGRSKARPCRSRSAAGLARAGKVWRGCDRARIEEPLVESSRSRGLISLEAESRIDPPVGSSSVCDGEFDGRCTFECTICCMQTRQRMDIKMHRC